MQLLDSPFTRKLFENDQFSLYCFEGHFDAQTRMEFDNENLGIFVCLRGSVQSGTRALSYQLQQQLVSFALSHRCEKVFPEGDVLMLFLLFPLSTLEAVLSRMGGSLNIALERFTNCQCTVAYSNQEISRAFTRLWKETTDRYPGHEFLAEITMREVLVHFLRLFTVEGREGGEGFLVAQIKAYLAANCHRRIGVDEVARHAGYSRGHLSKLFRQATGQSLVQYLNALRVEKACEQIRTGAGTIEEIAHEVGFQNLNHFYKTFKRITGRLPSAYKEGLMV